MSARRWVSIVTGLIVAGLGGVFVFVGLETADKLASSIGAIASVAGLGITLYLSLAHRPRQSSRPTDPTDPQPPSAAGPGDEADTSPPAHRHPEVKINHAQGVLIGDHNEQHIEFH
jgi:uncharacterized membrane protein YebE (DUF533 family)